MKMANAFRVFESRNYSLFFTGQLISRIGISNAISFLAVIVCLNLMQIPKIKIARKGKNAWADFKDGLTYTRSQKEIRKVLYLIGLICLLVATYNTLQPFYARDVFKGNAAMYGFITAATGVGALTSTLYIASQKTSSRLKQMLLINLILLGLGLIFMSYMSILSLYLLLCFVCGFGTMSVIPICNTIIQTVSDAHMRGRVVGFFAMAAFGTLPLGSLLIGWLAKMVHPQNCMLGQGILCLLIAGAFYRYLNTPMPILKSDKHNLNT